MNLFKTQRYKLDQSGASLLEVIVAVALFSIVTLTSLSVQNSVSKHKNDLKEKFHSIGIVNEIYRHLQNSKICECNFVNGQNLQLAEDGSVNIGGKIFNKHSLSYKASPGLSGINIFTGAGCSPAGSIPIIDIDPAVSSIYKNKGFSHLVVDDIQVIKLEDSLNPSNYQVELAIVFYNKKHDNQNGGVSGMKYLTRRFKLNVNLNAENQISACYNRDTATFKTIKMRSCPEGELVYDDTNFTSDETQALRKDRYKCSRDKIDFTTANNCFTQNSNRVGFVTHLKDDVSTEFPGGDGFYSFECAANRGLDANFTSSNGRIACPNPFTRLVGFDTTGFPICKSITKEDIQHLFANNNRGSVPPVGTASLRFDSNAPDANKFKIVTEGIVPPSTTTTTTTTTTSTSTTTTSTSTTNTSTTTTTLVLIDAIDDTIASSQLGSSFNFDVSQNDTSTNCAPIDYYVYSTSGVSVTGAGPNFSVTPSATSWWFAYEATCNNAPAVIDQAIVSGTATATTTTTTSTTSTSTTSTSTTSTSTTSTSSTSTSSTSTSSTSTSSTSTSTTTTVTTTTVTTTSTTTTITTTTTTLPPCGNLFDPCCTSGPECNGALNCVDNICQNCGGNAQSCCPSAGSGCIAGLDCENPGTCQPPCGALFEPCCSGNNCDGSLNCVDNMCQSCGGLGQACCPSAGSGCETGLVCGGGGTCTNPPTIVTYNDVIVPPGTDPWSATINVSNNDTTESGCGSVSYVVSNISQHTTVTGSGPTFTVNVSNPATNGNGMTTTPASFTYTATCSNSGDSDSATVASGGGSS